MYSAGEEFEKINNEGGVRGDQRRGVGGGPVGDHAAGVI